MFLTILLIVVALVAIMLGVAARKPDTFRTTRSIIIAADPGRIYAHLDDFHRWAAWSPWEKLDPALQRTFTGPVQGVGAMYAWEGNNKVGQGKMTVLEATAPTRLLIQLDFFKPFEAHNLAEFTLASRAGGTEVVWTMSGPNTFMSKVMRTLIDLDKMVGKDFEAGLANLKQLAESAPV